MAGGASSVRVDKWLWAVRVYKSRSAANDACRTGRVQVNEEVAKPATKVSVGDLVTAKRRDRVISYEVVALLEKRVSASLAAEAVIDCSPPIPDSGPGYGPDGRAAAGTRGRGSGRPTKRDRRRLDKLQGR
ncbi:MAG: RNA-binding S4 domain-containing protein [Actinomycetia bacterium]|nr:RNA-binding S4 domain-containing protein [Actinomycetes bacterium]